jgi:hypothetical protein
MQRHTDELIVERETRHQTVLLEPEDGRKGARKEDTLNGSESYQLLSECGTLVRYPLECPVSLALDTRNGLRGVEKVFALAGILDVCVNEE